MEADATPCHTANFLFQVEQCAARPQNSVFTSTAILTSTDKTSHSTPEPPRGELNVPRRWQLPSDHDARSLGRRRSEKLSDTRRDGTAPWPCSTGRVAKESNYWWAHSKQWSPHQRKEYDRDCVSFLVFNLLNSFHCRITKILRHFLKPSTHWSKFLWACLNSSCSTRATVPRTASSSSLLFRASTTACSLTVWLKSLFSWEDFLYVVVYWKIHSEFTFRSSYYVFPWQPVLSPFCNTQHTWNNQWVLPETVSFTRTIATSALMTTVSPAPSSTVLGT